MSRPTRSVFPLVPTQRVAGLPFGGVTSLRRGHGSDVAGSRAYVRGDPLSTIDWRASARLSTARGRDEFLVRERFAEEAPRVVVVCDYSPSMALYPEPFPWLSKPAVVSSVVELIVESAEAARAAVGYLDFAGFAERQGAPYWIAPQSRSRAEITRRVAEARTHDAPSKNMELALEFLARFRSALSSGTFVFIVSDFLSSTISDAVLLRAAARRWEVVPVVVQDPTWEQTFPLVGPLVLPLLDPDGGRVIEVRLSARRARAERLANERRFRALQERLHGLGLPPVRLESTDDADIDRAFLDWAAARADLRSRR
jgi:uncharacterized protein (DUF58 family)